MANFVGLGTLCSVVACGALALGCQPPAYYRIDSELTNVRKNTREVTASPQYVAGYVKVKTVAVRAPDTCADERAATATGSASKRDESNDRKSTVVATRCGVEMSELERALTKAGYAVISWKALYSTAAGKASDGPISQSEYLSTAKSLGAQMLFLVNSLERVKVTVGEGATWKRTFSHANVEGSPIDEIQLSPANLAKLHPFVEPTERFIASASRFGAMLDVSAVSTDSGQALWFYRAVQLQDADGLAFNTLVEKKNKEQWLIIAGGKPQSAAAAQTSNVEESSAGSADTETRQDQEYFELVRKVVADFAESFAKGKT